MATREIPRSEWPSFFDGFSRQHAGWLSTVEVLGSDVGAQLQARELPLVGVTADLKAGEGTISIMLGTKADEHIAHVVSDPARVQVKETAQGALEALNIESKGGRTTLLRFRSTIPPELVDGYVAR